MGKGSGSVTTFSMADGFITIDQHTEILEPGGKVSVQLLSDNLRPADLIVIGSHCVGLDILIGELNRRGFTSKVMHVGSTGGLSAVQRGECDLAGIHLLDPKTNEYNAPFLSVEQELLTGYKRSQGIVFRKDDARFNTATSAEAAIEIACEDGDCSMVNRNAGSGTRILIDQLLDGRQPAGYAVQAKSHNAVATSIVQSRSDWGMAIEIVANQYGLGFIPFRDEHYDFAVPRSRLDRPAVQCFRELLNDAAVRDRLSFK